MCIVYLFVCKHRKYPIAKYLSHLSHAELKISLIHWFHAILDDAVLTVCGSSILI